MKSESNIILDILRLVRSREIVMRQFLNPPRGTGSLEVRKVKRSLKAEARKISGFQLLTIFGSEPAGKHVIYFPGGAYLLETKSTHRQIAEKLAKAYALTVTLIDYPKSPEHNYTTTHKIVGEAYQYLLGKYPDQEFSLMGDSAGGGLALAFLQSLRDQGNDPVPGKTVLISPWLDLSLSHPDIPEYDAREFILPLDGLIHAAGLYTRGGNPKDPLISPIFGDLSNLGKIKLIFGSEEVFYPDCISLVDKISSVQGTDIDWHIGENLVHAWPILPFPQSKTALAEIGSFLSGDS